MKNKTKEELITEYAKLLEDYEKALKALDEAVGIIKECVKLVGQQNEDNKRLLAFLKTVKNAPKIENKIHS